MEDNNRTEDVNEKEDLPAGVEFGLMTFITPDGEMMDRDGFVEKMTKPETESARIAREIMEKEIQETHDKTVARMEERLKQQRADEMQSSD